KLAPPFKVVDVDILYGQGISRLLELIDMAAARGIINKAGAWYSYGDQRIGQGRDNARQFLEEHPEMADEIEARLRAEIMPPKERIAEDAAGGDEAGS
ncbi:MAG: DNA recombination/repair protein RecA, partial [Halothiobacillaceae bacterium]